MCQTIHQINHLELRTRNLVEISDDSNEIYNSNSQIRQKNSVLKLSLCNYSDAYTHVKRIVTVPNTAAAAINANNTDKKVIFINCASFTKYISKMNNTQVYNAEGINVVMPVNNLIEYNDIHYKTCGF